MSLDGLSCQHARMHLLLNFFVPIKQSEVEPVLYSFSALFTVSAGRHQCWAAPAHSIAVVAVDEHGTCCAPLSLLVVFFG